MITLKVILCILLLGSGGAIGSDTTWSEVGKKWGVTTKAYSYKTYYHISDDKVEISDSDYDEGILEVHKANKILNRLGINKYMNLLARNWSQVKYSDEVFAIGQIVAPDKRGAKGFYNKSSLCVVDGGSGYACTMCINSGKPLWVFDQVVDSWFRWSYITNNFVVSNTPKISFQNFTGIGTREISQSGINAIIDVYNLTFNK